MKEKRLLSYDDLTMNFAWMSDRKEKQRALLVLETSDQVVCLFVMGRNLLSACVYCELKLAAADVWSKKHCWNKTCWEIF